jgi:hypothetical protein
MVFEPGSPLWIAAVAAAQIAVIGIWELSKRPLHKAFIGGCWLAGRLCRAGYRMWRPCAS